MIRGSGREWIYIMYICNIKKALRGWTYNYYVKYDLQ